MTEQQMQQLSHDVAAKYGIDELEHGGYDRFGDELDAIWLHEDSARCFDLQNENLIGTKHLADYKTGEFFCVEAFFYGQSKLITEDYADHNNDKQEATRIAILRALLAKEVE